jgi:hypothetical protein
MYVHIFINNKNLQLANNYYDPFHFVHLAKRNILHRFEKNDGVISVNTKDQFGTAMNTQSMPIDCLVIRQKD